MSDARRPLSFGPSAILPLSEVEIHVFNDVHPYCNPGCKADCYGIAAVHRKTDTFSRVHSGHRSLENAIVELVREVQKKTEENDAVIAAPIVDAPPIEFQDLDS